MIPFQKLELKDQPIIEEYFKRGQYQNSECTFTNLFIWKDCYDVKWEIIDDFLIIQPGMFGENWILPPYGDYSSGKLPAVIQKLEQCFAENGQTLTIRGITADILQVLQQQCPGWFAYTEERDIEDYLYAAEDLRELKGRKYHGKRNHIHNFEKNYPDYVYETLTKDNINEAWEYLLEWCEQKAENGKLSGDLECEREAIREAFQHFDSLHYVGALIRLAGKVQAFTLGEQINDDTVVIHVEKANGAIQGLYSMINHEFLNREWKDITYVNREEDTGDEGLRKAKQSYYPIRLIEKYKAVFIPEGSRGDSDAE